MPEVPREAYWREYQYHSQLLAAMEQAQALLALFADKPELQSVVRELQSTQPNKILDIEKLQKLREADRETYQAIYSIYLPFLKQLAGVELSQD